MGGRVSVATSAEKDTCNNYNFYVYCPPFVIILQMEDLHMKTMLVIAGGGTWGVMPAGCLAEVEAFFNRPIYQLFDAIIGASTGAILGLELSAGVPAQGCTNLYVNKGKDVFKPRQWWNPFAMPKYDRANCITELSRSLLQDSRIKNANPKMRDLLTRFICTSTSVVDERTHYFKSWEDKDGGLQALDAVARSFAAAYYFGAIDDTVGKQVWADGGEGGDNLPFMDAYIEALRQEWHKEGLYILAFSCGNPAPGMSYEEARKQGTIGQAQFYLNLARRQSAREQVLDVQQIVKATGQNVLIDYVDFMVPKSWDKLDDVARIKDGLALAHNQFSVIAPNILTNLKNAKP